MGSTSAPLIPVKKTENNYRSQFRNFKTVGPTIISCRTINYYFQTKAPINKSVYVNDYSDGKQYHRIYLKFYCGDHKLIIIFSSLFNHQVILASVHSNLTHTIQHLKLNRPPDSAQ
jgi:hypothetical protein